MNTLIMDSEVLLLIVEVQLIKPNKTLLSLADPVVSGTTFNYSTEVKDLIIDDNNFGM